MNELLGRLTSALADRYTIEREIGAGGMATVYLAADLKHDRKVALKVLKPELAAVIGGERFVHEIKVTANLQHPNILALYDSGEIDSFLYYVMPYVEGESLRERLDREKQLSVEQSVEIARSVASALDYAHRNNVVHRDIKPENILLHEGQALVADFGIALAISAASGSRLTETGLSIGTPHYMSPEQATADRELDARSDVYSLGVLLYEMLVGQPPFIAPSAQAVVAKILTEEPASVSGLRRSVPPHVEGVVAKAMQKLPADRFASAQEFGRALTDVSFVGPHETARTAAASIGGARRGAPSARVAWAIAAVMTLVALVATIASLGSDSTPTRVDRQRITLWRDGPSAGRVRYATALAPDGSGIAFIGSVGGNRALMFKPNDAIEPTLLAGTSGAQAPFFSPDGQWIGFFSEGTLKKVSRTGGGAATLASGAHPLTPAGAWSDDGSVYFVDHGYGVRRVRAEGGESELLIAPGRIPQRGVLGVWPLPAGRGILFYGCTTDCAQVEVYVYDASADSVRMLFEDARGTWYVPGGYVLYTSTEGGAFAAPFDLEKLQVTGGAIPVLEGVSPGGLMLGLDGTLLYARGGAAGTDIEELVWVTRDGVASVVDSNWAQSFGHPALSPDGQTLAVGVLQPSGEMNVWLKSLDTGAATKLTFGGGDDRPVWAPDGGAISFVSGRGSGNEALHHAPVDGSGTVQALVAPGVSQGGVFGAAYSPDGQWLLHVRFAGGLASLHALHVESDSTIPLVEGNHSARAPSVSPDGRWFAFQSDRTGMWEVYVRPFPDASGGEWMISDGGGLSPRWALNGGEIFYLGADRTMWSVEVVPGTPFTTGERRPLFDASEYERGVFHQGYDVTPDGQRFLMVRERGVAEDTEVELVWVLNWLDELKAKMGG